MAQKTYKCDHCPFGFRQAYEKNNKSLLGKFWRWHINFCPGWKGYFTSRTPEEQAALRERYNFTKYAG